MPSKSHDAPMPLAVVILAAGQGKRMQSSIPKVLQRLAGAPLLAHVLELARSLDPASIHVVYGHGGEQVRQAFPDARLRWWHQGEQLGTAHALAQALPGIGDDERVLVLYGDVPLLRRSTVQALMARVPGHGLGVLSAELAEPTGYGRIVRDARGAVRRIVEESEAAPRERRICEINTGVLVVSGRRLRQWLPRVSRRSGKPERYLTDIIELAVRARARVAAVPADDAQEVLGINDRRQLASAEAIYRARRAEELMSQGVTVVDPARIDVRGTVRVGRDVVLDVNVVLEGFVIIGDGVQIGPSCVVSNATLGARTRLLPNCVVQDATIGSDCVIGPFARLRPETRLEDGVHLGNFVEVKKSHIGAGSKINHLTYIGDSEVGRDVNVGAGTVTCNYDGAHKWQTRIGDDAFIGSGSMLVAPVTVGAGATIGAGSTITSDAPPSKLTLARSRQLTVEQWQRPRKTRPKD